MIDTQIFHPGKMPQELDSLWDQLHLEDPVSSAFTSRHFASCVANSGIDVEVAVLSENSKVVAFLPFQYSNIVNRWAGVAQRVGAHMSDYFGVIATQNFRSDPTELLRQCKLSVLDFSHLDVTQKVHGLSGKKESYGVRYVIDGAPEKYWDQIKIRDKKFYAHTFRQVRRIERELGPLRLDFSVNTDSRHKLLDELIQIKRSQYKSTEVNDALKNSWTRDLLHELLEQNHPGCKGVLSALYAGDTRIAVHFGLQSKQCLHIWFPAYYQHASRFSPGRLLLKALIDNSPAQGINILDDGEATEQQQQKRMMSNQTHAYYSDFWMLPTTIAHAAHAQQSLRWRLKRMKAFYNRST